MPLKSTKKSQSGKTDGESRPTLGGKRYSFSGFFGQHRSQDEDTPKGKRPSNETQNPPTPPKSPTPSSPSGNPRRLSTPAIYLPKSNVPGDVQEAYQEVQNATQALSEEELRYIFSGAPHFLLEKGRRPQWYPHIIFPWDDSSAIQSLADRKPLHHPAFTLSTLHAHIPVSPEGAGIQIYPDDLTEKQDSKRPSFDIGVFEIPNMLSSRAKEDGCIGFRHYMELPLLYTPKSMQHPIRIRPVDKHLQLISGPRGKHEAYSDFRPNVTLDRLKLVAEGPPAWKRIGVRNCSMEALVARLQSLADLQNQIMLEGKCVTLLDKGTVADAHRQLFSTFLYPPPDAINSDHPDTFRFQVSTLTQILTIRGAWIDFSLTEWRTRAGQILWELPPHQDGDCLNDAPDKSLDTSLERKWLLIQIVLSAELLFRADVAAKVGIYNRSEDVPITPRDVYLMNSLRTDMLDWGLIFSRRVFENISFHYCPQTDSEAAVKQPVKEKSKRAHPIFSIHKRKEKGSVGSPWDCVLLPRYPWQQLEALIVFAEILRWPDFEHMKYHLKEKLEFAFSKRSTKAQILGSPVTTAPLPENVRPLGSCEMYRRSHSLNLVQLHDRRCPGGSSTTYLGGWLSRTWLTGLILPGEAICDILMCTLLENDHEAVLRLGPIANLYGAFIYKSRSWWSKICVVGKILAPLSDSTLCMGWISTTVIPVDETGAPLSEGWLEIETINIIKNMRQPRINQGTKVLLDSSPLGTEGDLTTRSFSLPLDEANSGPDRATRVSYRNTILSVQRSQDPSTAARPLKATASLAFTLTLPDSRQTEVAFRINYNVAFISSYPCLPPHGCIKHCKKPCAPQSKTTYHYHHFDSTEGEDDEAEKLIQTSPRTSRYRSRLPAHPLHISSFPYSYIPIHELPSTPFPPTPGQESPEPQTPSFPSNYLQLATDRGPRKNRPQRKHTYIIDACGSEDKELFSRSWCAMVGVSAVVGRVGRTCIACCIRQARAADVPVVIRVGKWEKGEQKCSTWRGYRKA
ncbi:hypothetical protein AJ79_04824 [Helicocarpus griseus UAMH5409]|uniref:Uncharacterized protein n=1 Tax=Helicocarpus griseus UAMH5409 TaxID=1447875 RepID=A0A2B7XQT3_9EURO|nr:hypothetical protein AJ79_04824 [Helicocarpus griseus UAMH5409]